MGKSVSKAVREVLAGLAHLDFAFEKRLVNESSLARFIKPRVEEKVGKAVSDGAIIASVHRYVISHNGRAHNPKLLRFLKSFRMRIRTGLVEINLKRTTKTAEHLALLAEKIKWQNDEKFYLLQRTDELTVIVDAGHQAEVLACAPKKDLLSKHEGRAVITVYFDPDAAEAYGGLHFLTGIFADLGVSIHVVFSTYSADSFVIKEKDVPIVYRRLSEALKELQAINPD